MGIEGSAIDVRTPNQIGHGNLPDILFLREGEKRIAQQTPRAHGALILCFHITNSNSLSSSVQTCTNRFGLLIDSSDETSILKSFPKINNYLILYK